MDDDPIPLDHLYAAMEAHIAEAIPALAYVGTMPDRLNLVPPPAVVIELTEWEPGHDPGTGEVGLDVRFEARVIVAGEEEHALRMAAFAAAQITILLRMQTWGLAVEPAKFVRAAQDWSRPELDGYAVWMVEWTQIVYLGREEWPWPVEGPDTLVFKVGPDAEHVQPEALE